MLEKIKKQLYGLKNILTPDTKHILGIDIGSGSIKIAEMWLDGDLPLLVKYAVEPIPHGPTERETNIYERDILSSISQSIPGIWSMNKPIVENADVLGALLNKIMNTYGFTARYAIISLGGETTRLVDTVMPVMTEEETREALIWELDKFVARSPEDYTLDFIIRESLSDNQRVSLVTMHIDDMNFLLDACSIAGIKPLAIECEPIAISRTVNQEHVTIVIDIGENYSRLILFEKGVPAMAEDITWGGKRFTDAIMENTVKNYSEAELYKKTSNCLLASLDASPEEMAIYNATEVIVEALTTFITNFVDSWLTKYPDNIISEVVLTGGGGKMESLALNLGINLLWPVKVHNPFAFIEIDEDIDKQSLKKDDLRLAIAAGLALRGSIGEDLC